MIDKSIRQHYQTGKEVGPFKKGKDIIMSALPQVKKITPTSIAKGAIQRGITKKLAGTGLLSSLGPIGTLLAMFLSRKGMDFASKKWGEGGVKQAYQAGMTGFGSPAEGRELRQLEKRRDYMLHRRDVLGKKISEKNLEEVTNRINKIKGDPYEFEDRRTAAQRKQVRDQLYEFEDKKTEQLRPQIIPKTPEIISPHLLDGADKPTPTLTTDFAFEDAKRAAQEKAEKQAAFDRAVAENAAKAAAEAAAQRAYAARVPDRIYGGGNDGNQGGGGGGQAAADAAGASSYSSPFLKGGRVDKAIGARSRAI